MVASAQESQEERLPFAERMMKACGKLLIAAGTAAIEVRHRRAFPPEQRIVINEELGKIPDDARGSFNGDMVALGLSGLLKDKDPEVEDHMLQINQGIDELYNRYTGKPFEKWSDADKIQMYKMQQQLDQLVDKIDICPLVVRIVLGPNPFDDVKGLMELRRGVGITRSCFYMEDARVCKNMVFARKTQDSVSKLLSMTRALTAVDSAPEKSEFEIPEFMADLKRQVEVEKKRRVGKTHGWAFRRFEAWLAGKEFHEEAPEDEQIAVLRDEIKKLGERAGNLKDDILNLRDPKMKKQAEAEVTKLLTEIDMKEKELKKLTDQPPENQVSALADPPKTVFQSGDSPAGSVVNTVPHNAEGQEAIGIVAGTTEVIPAGDTVEEEIKRKKAEIEKQEKAAETHEAAIPGLKEQAAKKVAAGEWSEVTRISNEIRTHGDAAKTARELVEKRKAELEELTKAKAEKDAAPAKTSPATPVTEGRIEVDQKEIDEITARLNQILVRLATKNEAKEFRKNGNRLKKELKDESKLSMEALAEAVTFCDDVEEKFNIAS